MADANKQPATNSNAEVPQPGAVISPNGSALAQSANNSAPAAGTPAASEAAIAPPISDPAPIEDKAAEEAEPITEAAQPQGQIPTENEVAEDTYTPEQDDPDEQAIAWRASEFIAHEKTQGWYMALAAVTLLIASTVFLLTRDKVSVGVVVVAGILLGMYANTKPRQMDYILSAQGLQIGKKHYGYESFRSFAMAPEGAFSSIIFMPLKRFAPLTTIYYPPEEEEKIVSILSNFLPFDEHGHDAVDRLMHRIRF